MKNKKLQSYFEKDKRRNGENYMNTTAISSTSIENKIKNKKHKKGNRTWTNWTQRFIFSLRKHIQLTKVKPSCHLPFYIYVCQVPIKSLKQASPLTSGENRAEWRDTKSLSSWSKLHSIRFVSHERIPRNQNRKICDFLKMFSNTNFYILFNQIYKLATDFFWIFVT